MKAADTNYYRQIRVEELELGMYVAELDRPWTESPFLFQGFHIRDNAELEQLQALCRHVVIDIERGPAPSAGRTGENRQADEFTTIAKRLDGRPRYPDVTTVEEELQAARDIYQQITAEVATLLEDVRAGNPLKAETMRRTMSSMIDSILRNPDAFLWLTRLKDKDSYTYAHSIDACSLVTAFGRHLGLAKSDLQDLAIGTLLFDIGKMKLPEELLNKPGKLTEAERVLVQEHVAHSVELASKIQGIGERSIQTILTHHERTNGSGYPRGLTGSAIPLFGRMAAIVDCYDAITSRRAYASPLSQHEAVLKLYAVRDTDFQSDLVEQFIQCLGVYPTGSLVELSTGAVGVVLSQNRIQRLRPKIMLVLDENKVAYDFCPIIDLSVETEDSRGNSLSIERPLEPGTYGIDPTELYL